MEINRYVALIYTDGSRRSMRVPAWVSENMMSGIIMRMAAATGTSIVGIEFFDAVEGEVAKSTRSN